MREVCSASQWLASTRHSPDTVSGAEQLCQLQLKRGELLNDQDAVGEFSLPTVYQNPESSIRPGLSETLVVRCRFGTRLLAYIDVISNLPGVTLQLRGKTINFRSHLRRQTIFLCVCVGGSYNYIERWEILVGGRSYGFKWV